MKRPKIAEINNAEQLKQWYWLKNELIQHCKSIGLRYSGTKFEILDRIADEIEHKCHQSQTNNSKRPTSKFDWHSEQLSLDTIITDSYKNSQNVRRFFIQHCGEKFHFSIPFMHFMKNNCGISLQDAIQEWKRQNEQSKNINFKSEIPSGNQFNKYMRDFFLDNPTMSIEQARHFWKLKRSLPLGKHFYEREDLELK